MAAPNRSWNRPAASGPSQHRQAVANLSKDGIREAQLELRRSGLYNGSLDGVIGPETRQALFGSKRKTASNRRLRSMRIQ
jgi:peptidoglycan hydrolase-like protein with peptidoglycan-binding domain